jgi:FKBP-type peptidyl-prolyl cis-trans isomerase FklB
MKHLEHTAAPRSMARAMLLAACLVMAAMGLTACSETDNDDGEYANWAERNTAYYNSIYSQATSAQGSGEWVVMKQWTLADELATKPEHFVVARVLNHGEGSGCPLYTDSIYVHYRLRFMPTTQHPQGLVVQETWSGDYTPETMQPVRLAVNGITGWETAIQHMHIGDRWLLYIPCQQAYGLKNGQDNGIPDGSTLIYDVTLAGYYRSNASYPDWKSKDGGTWIWE